jgi:3-hydroxybutyryl-CoA dehydrogenase
VVVRDSPGFATSRLGVGDRFAAPALLHDKVARGELGRKSGQGFFSWEAS